VYDNVFGPISYDYGYSRIIIIIIIISNNLQICPKQANKRTCAVHRYTHCSNVHTHILYRIIVDSERDGCTRASRRDGDVTSDDDGGAVAVYGAHISQCIHRTYIIIKTLDRGAREIYGFILHSKAARVYRVVNK